MSDDVLTSAIFSGYYVKESCCNDFQVMHLNGLCSDFMNVFLSSVMIIDSTEHSTYLYHFE